MNFESYSNFKLYRGKYLMALDYGTVAVGLATFVPGRDPFPVPYGKIAYKNDQDLALQAAKIIKTEGIELLIVGLPLYLDGKESKMTATVKSFVNVLTPLISCPILFQDETLSTFEAEDRMKKSPQYNFRINPKEIDALAATIILEDFIKASSA